MAYFYINGNNYSDYVNKLTITTNHKYSSRESASGTLITKYIATKHIVQVGIIPLDDITLNRLLDDINQFDVTVKVINPNGGEYVSQLMDLRCIIPANSIEYYTIRTGNTMTKAFTFTCEEK